MKRAVDTTEAEGWSTGPERRRHTRWRRGTERAWSLWRSLEGRTLSEAAQLRVTVSSSCRYVAFVFNQTSSLTWRMASVASTLGYPWRQSGWDWGHKKFAVNGWWRNRGLWAVANIFIHRIYTALYLTAKKGRGVGVEGGGGGGDVKYRQNGFRRKRTGGNQS